MSAKPPAKTAASRPPRPGPPSVPSSTATSARARPSHSSSATTTTATTASSYHLPRYREILIARSDGVGYSTQQINNASRSALPVGDPLPDAHDAARSWAVKLGKALKYNLGVGTAVGTGTAPDPTNYLVRLPAGYTLHVRPHKGTRDARGKGSERDGLFVFGHPLGPIAAYRSPAELALHLLWLLSNSTDRSDCSCRLCVRMVSEALGGPVAAVAAVVAAPPVPVPVPAPSPAVAPATANPAPTIQVAIAPAAPSVTAAAPPPPVARPSNTSTPSTPNPVPVGGSAELFRPWELVWYQPPQKNAWRLGIVLQLLPDAAVTNPSAARVAPLGVPGVQAPALTLPLDVLRPFLSFSVPDLRDGFQDRAFEAIAWTQLVRESAQAAQAVQAYAYAQAQAQARGQTLPPGAVAPPAPRFDTATLTLEASKAAANQINACFSLFGAQPKTSLAQHMYGGVFLGAEQVVVGDAVRVDARPETGSATGGPAAGTDKPAAADIMRIHFIMMDHGSLRFIGDVYRLALTTTPAAAAVVAATAPPEGQLFAEELQDRNGVQSQGKNSAPAGPGGPGGPAPRWYWHLCERNGHRAENEVHGRFYVSMRLAANLRKTDFLSQAAAGRVSDDMIRALNRRQQVAGFRYLGQRNNRAATIAGGIAMPLPPIGGVVEEA